MKVARQLSLIGLDEIVGWAPTEVVKAEQDTGGGVTSIAQMDPRALAARLEGDEPKVIDVRGRSEWNHGHLPKASHIFLGNLMERSDTLGDCDDIVVHCESGTRSSIAASLLMSRGFRNVSNLAGGFDAWRKAGLPIIHEDP